MPEMLSHNSRLLIGIFIAAMAVAVAVHFWDRALPTAALQFNLTESAAETNSRGMLKELGYETKGYYAATKFGEDSDQKNYVEKEFGVRTLEKKVREGINLWYWTTRFFKPEQEEEFSVSYDPQGRFVGFSHTIKDTDAAPKLTREQARAMAEDFLKRYVTHHPFEKLKFFDDSSRQLKHRIDYDFDWQQEDLRLGDGLYLIHVQIQGNRVGEFNEYVKIPEVWQRKFETERSSNALFQTLAESAELPISVAVVILFVLYTMDHQIRWRNAVPKRWLLLFGLVQVFAVINDIPELLSGYSTTARWGSFIFSLIGSNLLSIIYIVAKMYVLSLVADAIYREKFTGKLSFARALGRNSLYRPETVKGLGVGIVLACFGMGYMCAFYVVAGHFGAWSPVDIDYSKILGGPIPWISGIQVGMEAAWNEEFTYRVIGVLLYWKLLRWRWPGVILAGMTWAFLHSNYPQMPGYVRGCELTVEGILWGALMIRYGVVATLTGHYLYDCWLDSLVTLQTLNPWHVAGALAVSLWPVALWLIGMYRIRTGAIPPGGPDQPEPPFKPPVYDVEGEQRKYAELAKSWNFKPVALSTWQRFQCVLLYAVVLAFMLLAAYVPSLGLYPSDAMADYGEIDLSRKEIGKVADKILKEHGKKPSDYLQIISLDSNSLEHKYLLEFKSADEVADLYETEWTDIIWRVRYFRFEQKEEFSITLDKKGNLVNWTHDVAEEAPGASLSKEAALALAEKQLADVYGVDMSQEQLIADNLTQQLHRRDYAFTWNRVGWNWGDSQLQTTIQLQGDEAVNFGRMIKVPDAWYRKETHGGWKNAILGQISKWSSGAMILVVLLVFIIMVRHRVIPWKAGFLIALAPAALRIVGMFNDWPWFYDGYDTTTPLRHYLWEKWSDDGIGLLNAWLQAGFLLSVTFGLLTWAFGWKLKSLRWPSLDWRILRRTLPDFLTVLVLSFSVLWFNDYFTLWVNTVLKDPDLYISTPSVNFAIPWLNSLQDAIKSGYDSVLQYALWFAIGVRIYRWRSVRWLLWAVLLAYPFYTALHIATWHEYILSVSMSEFHRLITLYLVWKVWRFDVSMIFLCATLPSLFQDIGTFLDKGGNAYENQAWPLIAASLVLVLLGWWLRPAPEGATVSTVVDLTGIRPQGAVE